MSECKAEVMSIGDEMTSGQRLDTNTQWISQRLGEMGIHVGFHSTIGDDLADHVHAVELAIERADLLVMTGGLGPTADDLTREAIAQAAGVSLDFDEGTLTHIEGMYRGFGREMPASNRSQAYFPAGTQIIPNPEGTAPGIDLSVVRNGETVCRIIALPGVPAEMKQMWGETIDGRLRSMFDDDLTIHHHTLHCFGAGESSIEEMLPGLVRRGRDPQVGITASAATISLRVMTRGISAQDCLAKMQPTIDLIRDGLGDLVFGENGQSLEGVVVELASGGSLKGDGANVGVSLAISDAGLSGIVAETIIDLEAENDATIVKGHRSTSVNVGAGFQQDVLADENVLTNEDVLAEAKNIRSAFDADLGIAIGRIDFDEKVIAAGRSHFEVAIVGVNLQGKSLEVTEQFRFAGHSAWRKQRAVKQVLNLLRLNLTS